MRLPRLGSPCYGVNAWITLSVFSLGHADHITHTFVSYYNEHRPHEGVANRLLSNHSTDWPEETERVETIGRIGCRSETGGLLKYYHRCAA